jgi:hypothetical protein
VPKGTPQGSSEGEAGWENLRIKRLETSESNELRKKCGNSWAGKASAAFSNSFPIKLAQNSENTLIRYANATFFHALREMSSMGVRKIKGLSLVSQAGRRFVKASARLLAIVLSKRLRNSCSESTQWFS